MANEKLVKVSVPGNVRSSTDGGYMATGQNAPSIQILTLLTETA